MSTMQAPTQDKAQKIEDRRPRAQDNAALHPPSPALPSPERLSTLGAKSSDLILFTTQLAIMLDSGVILSDALDAIAEQAADARFQAILLDLSERIKGGDTFSKALSC